MTSRSPIVIDASAVASWLLPDETSGAYAEILQNGELHAPVLFWAEMRNILVISGRRGRLTDNMVSEAISILDALNVNLDNAPDGNRVLQLARGHDLTVYDAIYLELALRLQTPFLTLDKKLAKAAERESIRVQKNR